MTEAEQTQLVYRLRRGLRRSNPMSSAIDAALAGNAPSSQDIDTALSWLEGSAKRKSREKSLASWLISRSTLTREQSDLALVRLVSLLHERPGHNTGCLVMAGCVLSWMVVLWVFIASLYDAPVNRVRLFAATALGKLGRPEAVLPLSDAATELDGRMAASDTSVRRSAALALANLLPSVPNHGYGTLHAKSIRSIIRLLLSAPPDITPSILSVIGMAGTGGDIRQLKRMERKMRTPESQRAYHQTLATLEDRARRENEQSVLLRPASSPGSPEQILLRPASSGEPADMSQLLRPAYEAEQPRQNVEAEESAPNYLNPS